MSKKILAAVISAVMLICMAGCSGNYVMTEEDLAVQKSIEGCWLADDSTGYNSYDGNGNFLSLTAVQFTEDYKYLLHVCMPGDGQASGYVMTYDPIAYTFEDKMFRVEIDGVASYARVSVSEDGQT
ncbi:MAG: YgdI/YgdR family lipoprotein, partial [Oscillospiraceae bacterium]|nr:YgdI/YgdR family lipoprotein [Oscillospiraceae bacterium]